MRKQINVIPFKNECGVYDSITLEYMQSFVDNAIKSGATHFDLIRIEPTSETGIALGHHQIALTAYREQTELEKLQNEKSVIERDLQKINNAIAALKSISD